MKTLPEGIWKVPKKGNWLVYGDNDHPRNGGDIRQHLNKVRTYQDGRCPITSHLMDPEEMAVDACTRSYYDRLDPLEIRGKLEGGNKRMIVESPDKELFEFNVRLRYSPNFVARRAQEDTNDA